MHLHLHRQIRVFFNLGCLCYAINLNNGVEGYPLQCWVPALQYLHVVRYCTITTTRECLPATRA